MKHLLFNLLYFCSLQSIAQPFGKGELLVLNKSDHNVSFISLETGKETAVVGVGKNPHEVALSPRGNYAAVTNYGSGENPGNSISIIDIVKREVIDIHQFNEGIKPHGIQFVNDEVFIFTAEGTQSFYIVKLTGEVVKVINTAQRISHMLAYDYKSQLAFVANIGSGSVTVIDIVKREKLKDIITGGGAEGIAVHPNGTEVWVTNREDNSISIIDIKTLKVIEELTTEDFPIRVQFTTNGSLALISCAKSGTVMVFDAKTKSKIKSIAINEQEVKDNEGRLSSSFGEGPIPIGILIHPSDKFAYIANTNADILTMLDLGKLEICGRISTRSEPDGLGYIE
ncbi:MAG: cytochrome D1 domain-containing protein [Fulvivirga sp.]|uniref:YncE family protein n=1 Tax=Fulvivirga sp. TaxID=1931237 RepID=UPI0032EB507D